MKLSRCEQLLRQVQVAGFAVMEAKLYLDTHGNETEALNRMKRYQRQLKKATEEYEAACGPLTAETADLTCGWRWTDSPWPWELEG